MMGAPTLHNARSGGFTLIETVAAVFVTGLTVMLAMTVLVASMKNCHQRDAVSSANHAVEVAMEYVARDLRSAQGVLGSYGGYTTSASGIAFESPAYDGSGIIAGVSDRIMYRLDEENNLLRTTIAGGGSRANETDRVLAENINSLALTYICMNQYQGNGTTTTFNVAHSWAESPTVSVNGVTMTGGYGLNPGDRTIIFASAPASGAVIEVSYAVSPSDASALADVQTVRVRMSSQVTEGGKVETAPLETCIRLRNKR